MIWSNPTLEDVAKSFGDLSENASEFSHYRHSDANQSPHIQGMGWWRDTTGQQYVFISHNQSDGDGYCLIGGIPSGSQQIYSFGDIGISEGWHHPGGVQAIGSYVIVSFQPVEEAGDEGKVWLLEVNGENKPNLAPPILLAQLSKDAACCGIAFDGKKYFMCVYSSKDGTTSTYVSNESKLGLPTLQFELSSTANLGQGYDNIALVAQDDGKVFMIGLRGDGDSHITDYADLYRIDQLPSLPHGIAFGPVFLQTKHFINKGGLAGEMGPHFRWGAGAAVIAKPGQSNALSVFCTSRHFEPTSDMVMNYWGADINSQ